MAVKESICCESTSSKQFVDERVVAMQFLLSGFCNEFDFIVAYAATEVTKDAEVK